MSGWPGPIVFAGIYAEREDGSLGCAILIEPALGAPLRYTIGYQLTLDYVSLETWLDPDLTDRETLRNVERHLDPG